MYPNLYRIYVSNNKIHYTLKRKLEQMVNYGSYMKLLCKNFSHKKIYCLISSFCHCQKSSVLKFSENSPSFRGSLLIENIHTTYRPDF